MIFATSFHAGDKDQAARLLAWIKELGGYERHRFFVMPAKGQRADFTDAPPFEVVQDCTGITSDWANPGAVRDASGPNSTIRQFAWRFYQSGFGPWMFLEPDCIPLVPEWADKIDAEYKVSGKAFMGARVPGKPGEYSDHSTGNMVLPQDVAGMSQHLMLPRYATIDGKTVEIAFDVAAADDVLANYHDTPLLHHVFRGPEFVSEADLQRIWPGAVLFHTAKGPGLVRLLREKRFGARHGVARDVQTETVSPTADVISETPRTKVFTYFAPVQSVEGLAEQKRLIELWRSSWRKYGWEPVVLTEEDAAKHPRFEEWKAAFTQLPTVNPRVYEMACWLRWVAMAMCGGMLTDYDTLAFAKFEFTTDPADELLVILGDHVPCAVVGTAQQYAKAVELFVRCPHGRENDQPHLSDMLAVNTIGYKSLGVCKEYKAPGWETADMVHFSHASCKPDKRSDVIADALERPSRRPWVKCTDEEAAELFRNPLAFHVTEPTVSIVVSESVSKSLIKDAMNTNGSKPESIVGLIRDGVGILSQLATNGSRKASILNELRKAGLVCQAKKRK